MRFVKVYETPEGHNYFFGYYDKSPLNASATRLLAQRTPFINRMPQARDAIEVGYFDCPGGTEFKPIAQTRAWNWQQGSMLQWLGPDFESRIIYNDIRDGRYVSVIYDFPGGKETVLPLPVYAVASDGQFALCVDYDRLYWFRPGYNYQGTPRPEKHTAYDPNDGVWRISLVTAAVNRVVSIQDAMSLGQVSSMASGIHYLEHIMINPANDRFAFLHRWLNVDGGIFGRLLSADVNGGRLCLLNDSGRMSHFCWRDAQWVFGYGGAGTALNRLRGRKNVAKHLIRPLLPLYHRLFPSGGAVSRIVTGDCYLLFRDLAAERRRIDRDTLPEDGHPTFSPNNRNLIVNDTYPDGEGNCRLYLFDVKSLRTIAETIVESDPAIRATGYRCDLHPKWSHDARYVCVDTGKRRGRGITAYAVSD